MKSLDSRHFAKFEFTKEQVEKNFGNASKDLNIAKVDKILEVKFNYTYNAFIKAGIALLSFYKIKVRSTPGHHIKLIEKTAEILKDDTIEEIGNIVRQKRNLDFYGGGIEVTEKECKEYLYFVEKVFKKIKSIIA
ncbi:MAG: hypothetical protein HQ570_04405 [Candidatus Omnitrophica bacterium]|nr:hypothetical protein [Candidatus Omnitrophota bacterium]